jgi:hypothetical protein
MATLLIFFLLLEYVDNKIVNTTITHVDGEELYGRQHSEFYLVDRQNCKLKKIQHTKSGAIGI